MNEKLAAQLLSDSVAKSLQFCLNENISEFKGCEAIVDFVLVFHALFDVMNFRNLCSSCHKRPLHYENASEINTFLKRAGTYIRELQLSNGLELLVLHVSNFLLHI